MSEFPREHEKDQPIISIDDLLPMTSEIGVDGTLKINIGRMSDELYDNLPDSYKEYVEECKLSDSTSNFRKFKNDTIDELDKETDVELFEYKNLILGRITEIISVVNNTFKDSFTYENSGYYLQDILHEMITNALHHGNCNDTRKNVVIEAKIVGEGEGAYLEFSIEDEGNGFDVDKVVGLENLDGFKDFEDLDEDELEERLLEQLENNYGRGILIAKSYSIDKNSLNYEYGGRKAILKLSLHNKEEIN